MAYSAALNTVYNHYLTAYAPKTVSRYDTHKKSELRNVYNSIVKLNKESPLYLPETGKETQEFAVGLKENTRQLRNTIASLGGLKEDELLNKKVAYSNNKELVSASFIGEAPKDKEAPSFCMEVLSLASGQINTGKYLPSASAVSMEEGAYSFDIAINDLSYEFQYNIRQGETNREVQERLSRLVSSADIGIRADIAEDGNGNSALRLSSVATGLKDGQTSVFYVSDDNTGKRKGSVEYLGLQTVTAEPSNAEFLLNGERRTALSNHFTVDKMFEIHLNKVSAAPGDEAEIGLKTDVDSLTENVSELLNGYNSFIGTASDYKEAHPKSNRLINEMNHIARLYQEGFGSMGISMQESGQLSLNAETLRESALADGGKESLSSLRDFANSLLRKTDQISLNPMEYVDKTIVAYKNPGHNFASPYITSAYSGMLFNGYC